MIYHAKKSLSQNFLKSKPALEMMIKAGEVDDNDIILEIGPGKGALTSKLLEKAKKVIAVEKDSSLIRMLEEKFKNEIKNKKLILINEDILKFKFPLPFTRGGLGRGELIDPLCPSGISPLSRGRGINEYKIIANIPYNITGAIIKKFLSGENQPSVMILLVQKEVADRITARSNKESILSLSVKAYGTPKYVMKVGKRFFSPSPKVDSAIISIKDISRKNFKTPSEEEQFFKIIKSAFAHKRKVLRKNLEEVASLETIDFMFAKLGINQKIRAEDVPFTQWLSISRYLSENA
ncbi:MAG TPA: 16S rRNA (adenine(1518)-N(6)/adenine(1519)-N(6))-dimethyltransferase RsmA [Candidatus Paceibacterota bacterium]|jgi:16S rRNA (adenine1518-N6/adenine1519-N6)-dimethyltransferase|nr:16S rRNA (adenine(1518)-N(6)/adenine(1519)-N(6))-dimethyltransferase RsmA [Candidatus Paceibacterota bacterium]